MASKVIYPGLTSVNAFRKTWKRPASSPKRPYPRSSKTHQAALFPHRCRQRPAASSLRGLSTRATVWPSQKRAQGPASKKIHQSRLSPLTTDLPLRNASASAISCDCVKGVGLITAKRGAIFPVKHSKPMKKRRPQGGGTAALVTSFRGQGGGGPVDDVFGAPIQMRNKKMRRRQGGGWRRRQFQVFQGGGEEHLISWALQRACVL